MNSPLRRASDAAQKPVTFKQVAIGIAIAVGAALVIGATQSYDASKLDTSRFVADSIRRESDRDVLLRVDRRVRAMYCAGRPAGCE